MHREFLCVCGEPCTLEDLQSGALVGSEVIVFTSRSFRSRLAMQDAFCFVPGG
jgi:hypothetical protein